MRPTRPMRILAFAAAGGALVLAVGVGAAAQDQPPHPAHIHDGSCETIGDIVHPLIDVSAESLVDGQPGAGDVVGDPSDDPADLVQVSITTVDATIEDLTSAEFAINVHLSADEMGVFIACGDVAGTLVLDETDEADDETDETDEADDDDVALAIRLREQSDSGAQGIAWLTPGDDDDADDRPSLPGPGPAPRGGPGRGRPLSRAPRRRRHRPKALSRRRALRRPRARHRSKARHPPPAPRRHRPRAPRHRSRACLHPPRAPTRRACLHPPRARRHPPRARARSAWPRQASLDATRHEDPGRPAGVLHCARRDPTSRCAAIIGAPAQDQQRDTAARPRGDTETMSSGAITVSLVSLALGVALLATAVAVLRWAAKGDRKDQRRAAGREPDVPAAAIGTVKGDRYRVGKAKVAGNLTRIRDAAGDQLTVDGATGRRRTGMDGHLCRLDGAVPLLEEDAAQRPECLPARVQGCVLWPRRRLVGGRHWPLHHVELAEARPDDVISQLVEVGFDGATAGPVQVGSATDTRAGVEVFTLGGRFSDGSEVAGATDVSGRAPGDPIDFYNARSGVFGVYDRSKKIYNILLPVPRDARSVTVSLRSTTDQGDIIDRLELPGGGHLVPLERPGSRLQGR